MLFSFGIVKSYCALLYCIMLFCIGLCSSGLDYAFMALSECHEGYDVSIIHFTIIQQRKAQCNPEEHNPIQKSTIGLYNAK